MFVVATGEDGLLLAKIQTQAIILDMELRY